MRHDLHAFQRWPAALEKKVAEEGVILTESQIVALERKRAKEEASGEIETEHPGYLGSDRGRPSVSDPAISHEESVRSLLKAQRVRVPLFCKRSRNCVLF
jgi:hypothetical protein